MKTRRALKDWKEFVYRDSQVWANCEGWFDVRVKSAWSQEPGLDLFTLAQARQKYWKMSEVDVATKLTNTHTAYNTSHGDAKKHFNEATLEFLEESGFLQAQTEK